MKKAVCLSVAFVLLSFSALAQNSTKTGSVPRAAGRQVVMIAGQVSDGGQTFVNSEINKWKVANAVLLKEYEGEYVTVRCHVDPDAHTIHVLSVSREQLVKANPGDSAFRR
jgi:hypothetical protein